MAGFGDELLILRGPTGVVDQSGNGNDGTYNGGMGTVSDTGSGGSVAFLFDGSNDFISLPVPVVSAMPLTLAAWIKVASGAASASIISIDRASGVAHYWQLRFVAGSSITAASAAGGTGPAGSVTGVVADTWQLAIGEFVSATSRTPILDGTRGTTSPTSRSPTAVDEMLIGFGRSGLTGYFNGCVDDVRVFDRVLTSGEISDWFAAGRGYDIGNTPTNRRRTTQTSIRSTL